MSEIQSDNPADQILAELRLQLDRISAVTETGRFCVALSGGIDSTVLLHAMTHLGSAFNGVVRAVHVNHQIDDAAGDWADYCHVLCGRLGVPLDVHVVELNVAGGLGPEATARQARYAVIQRHLRPGEVLLTAHHLDDQFETVLLQLMRGAGVAGLAAMPIIADFGPGSHLRPLLNIEEQLIRAYARQYDLAWIEDPSNRDTDLDRNYLRHEILPRLSARWPAAAETAGRSARLCAEAADLLEEVAERDARELLHGNRLQLDGLRLLTPPRQRNLIRYAIRRLGYPVPSERRLAAVLRSVVAARDDGQPVVRWAGAQIRRYRDNVYLLSDDVGSADDNQLVLNWDPTRPLDMGAVRGSLTANKAVGLGLAGRCMERPLSVRFRMGGERIRREGDRQSRTLKNLLQEAGVVPWMRSHIPLIYAGDRLVAVADLWVDAEAAAGRGEQGYKLSWTDHAGLR